MTAADGRAPAAAGAADAAAVPRAGSTLAERDRGSRRRDLLTRWRNYLTRWRGKPYLASFALGSMAITKHEDEGRKLLKRLLHARQDSAAAVLQRSIRSMLAQHRQPQHELQQQEQMSSE